MMIYIYEMCPRCMDELIERKQPFEDHDSVNYCSKCGKELECAIYGEQKIDDTVYKIILNDTDHLTDHMNRKNRFLKELMKMGNITFDEALEKCRIKDCLIFEGNIREIYIKLDSLARYIPDIHFTVVPDFLFERCPLPCDSICHTCGSDLVDKEGGTFCEKCNKWVALPPL